MNEIILAVVMFTYHGDGSITTHPQQLEEFDKVEACEQRRAELLDANWLNPLPIPEDVKPAEFSFRRYRTSVCEERRDEGEEKPEP
jgi:hypothetical protein